MEKPMMASSSLPSSSNEKKEPQKMRKTPPTPEELISYYESQGMDTAEASKKVIQDLQSILLKTIHSSGGKTLNSMAEISRKLDNANTRLAILEMKVDSKPGYADTLAIGVAAGATLRGIGSVFPHVVGALGDIWNSVRATTSSRTRS